MVGGVSDGGVSSTAVGLGAVAGENMDGFPSMGVSLSFLLRIREDPRLQAPMLLSLSSQLGLPEDPASLMVRLEEEYSLEDLAMIGRDLRVFSD